MRDLPSTQAVVEIAHTYLFGESAIRNALHDRPWDVIKASNIKRRVHVDSVGVSYRATRVGY